MGQERQALRGGTDQQALLFECNDINRLTRSEAFRFEHLKLSWRAVLGTKAMHVSEKPRSAKKESDDKRERTDHAENGNGERRRRERLERHCVGTETSGCRKGGEKEETGNQSLHMEPIN
jgi:hypothetical protein